MPDCALFFSNHSFFKSQAHGYSKPVGAEHAGLWARISFSWIG